MSVGGEGIRYCTYLRRREWRRRSSVKACGRKADRLFLLHSTPLPIPHILDTTAQQSRGEESNSFELAGGSFAFADVVFISSTGRTPLPCSGSRSMIPEADRK